MVLSTDFIYLLIIVVILEILATIGIVLISIDKKTKIVIFILDFFLLIELNQNKKYFSALSFRWCVSLSVCFPLLLFFINVFLQMKERICGKTELELRWQLSVKIDTSRKLAQGVHVIYTSAFGFPGAFVSCRGVNDLHDKRIVAKAGL